MKDILIVLLVIAVLILVLGAVNQDQKVDFGYLFGTWRGVSVLELLAIGAGVTVVAGLGAASYARTRMLGDRRKLEKELEQVYGRLREAEARLGVPATAETGAAPLAAAPAGEGH